MGRFEKIAIIGVLICFLQIITTLNNINENITGLRVFLTNYMVRK